jgi:hypothetical protein
MRRPLITAVACVVLAVLAGPSAAHALVFGSTLRAPANAGFGCDVRPAERLFGGIELQPTGATTCTWAATGITGTLRRTFFVPRTGVIRSVSVRVGANPAPLRVTILSSQTAIDARGIAVGSPACCTVERFGRVFRPRANRVTTVRVNLPVRVDADDGLRSTDGVAITAVGPGTLPIAAVAPGSFDPGSPIAASWHPRPAIGQPAGSGAGHVGFEVLLRADWRPRRG